MRVKGPAGLAPTASIAAIVAAGVLPLRPVQRPEAITRLAISFAGRGSPAVRRTSIATCFADSPLLAGPRVLGVLVAMVVAPLVSSLWLGEAGARRLVRLRSSAG